MISPASTAWLALLSPQYFMASQQPENSTPDPPIYKFLSPKTQGFLRASAKDREEAARLNDAMAATEQTYVKHSSSFQLMAV
jgi:hypothetical protein